MEFSLALPMEFIIALRVIRRNHKMRAEKASNLEVLF